MHNRRARGLLIALVAALVATVVPVGLGDPRLGAPAPASAVTGDNRPNIVLIMVDDARVDDLEYLPAVRRLLGRRGVTFRNAFASNPVCCPARASLLTAQHTHNNGVATNQGEFGGIEALRRPDNTIAKWLDAAGYQTAYFGKYLNRYYLRRQGLPAGWDYFNALGQGAMAYTDFQTINHGDPIRYDDPGDYVTTQLTIDVTRAIGEYAGLDRPFFIFDAQIAPHKAEKADGAKPPPIPESQYADDYPNARNPAFRKPSFNEDDMSDKIRKMQHWDKASKRATQRLFLARIRSLRSVDDHVTAVVDTLRKTGELDDTVIVFVSDNGMALGEHRSTFKKWAFDEVLRVPLIIRGPGFASGATSRRWVTQVDVAQTVVDLANATPLRRTDGISLRGASGRDSGRPRPLLIQSGNETANDPRDYKWSYKGVRLGRYTYTRHWPRREEQLYDSVVDPHQLRSKHRSPRYDGVLRKLRRIYDRLVDCKGPDECSPPPVRRIPKPD